MAVLSGLALGETLRIRENGEFQDFTVIARGTHGTNEADTLVIRRDLLAPCTYFFASAEYEGSTPDRWLSYGYLNTLQDSVRVNLVPASLPCWDEFHKEQKTLVRRCFLLSATELGFVDESRVPVEGTAIPYFANDAARVAQRFGQALPYGTRTPMKSVIGNSVHIISVGASGEQLSHPVLLYELLTRPAMILRGSLTYDAATREVID